MVGDMRLPGSLWHCCSAQLEAPRPCERWGLCHLRDRGLAFGGEGSGKSVSLGHWTECHFLNGVLKCDSLVCVRVCLCACVHSHALLHGLRMKSDLKIFGTRWTNRELSP